MFYYFFRTHLQDLKQVTTQIHYERFRHERLQSLKDIPLNAIGSNTPFPKLSSVKKEASVQRPKADKSSHSAAPKSAAEAKPVNRAPSGKTSTAAPPKSTAAAAKPPAKAASPKQTNATPPKANVTSPNGSAKTSPPKTAAAKSNPITVTQQKKNGVTHVTA